MNLQKGHVVVLVDNLDGTEKLEIKLSLRKNVIENANVYYEKSKSAKEKYRGAEKALLKTKKQLENLESEQIKIERIKLPKVRPSVGRHFWFERFHWFITSTGNLVVAGRDAKSNDQVVKRYLKEKDRYCHADLSGAASVVVKYNSEAGTSEITEKTLTEACQFSVV